uniref:Phospholipase A(2) n=1 Tax=Heterorhabditis bacteriophora TaxID=37862 RepID=A0A1I7X1U1_HETBA
MKEYECRKKYANMPMYTYLTPSPSCFSYMLVSSWVPILLSLFRAVEMLNSEENDSEINWQCGTDDFTKYISENQIDIDCPALKESINKCCLIHDSCYDDQLGRTYCDDSFCHCLDEATRSSMICNREDGPLFCGMVRHFGEEAYRRSGNVTLGVAEDFLVSKKNNHNPY